MKKFLALLCAALFFIVPMTALASGASTPTRIPDIGEAVTAYTKDDYILNFSAIRFSVMDANGVEQNGGLSGLENVMKIWVHTADNQSFTAYCLNMAKHYPPTIAASQESMISQFPQNYTTVAWPAGANYDKMLWVVEHTYPAIPMDTMMADAGASFSRLASEIQTAQSISQTEAETLAESVIYATIQQAIWHHQPAQINADSNLYVGANMLNGSQDLRTLYSYLTKERAEYADYRNASIGTSITIDHPADMTPKENSGAYVFGPFTIGTDMLSAGDVQLAHTGSSALNVFFADASGNPISSIRQGKQFYVRASGTPTEPITIMVKANTANAVTLDANRGRMFVCTDDTADVQPVGIGGIPHIQSASATLTLPTLNPPASPAQTGEPVTFKKTDAESGAVLQGAVIRIDNAAGERVWQGETGADGLAVTDVELEYDTDYTYYEVSAPTGYDLDNTHCTLRISRDGGNPAYWSVTNRLTVVENPPVLTDVTLKKADADTGAGLAGAKFKVMDASGAAIGVFVTGNDGTVTVKNLKPGSYQWSEQEAPVGYTLNKTVQSFTISDTGVVSGSTTISNEKIKPSVTLKKVDEQGKPLAGATIKVQDAAGKEVFNGKTDADGKVTVSGLALNTTYTYFGYSAPVGYELNSTKYTFTVDNAGNVSKPQDIVNKKTVTATPTCTPPVIVPAAPVLLPPKTGDMGSGGVIGVCLMVTAVCAWIVIWYRHWQNENRGDER